MKEKLQQYSRRRMRFTAVVGRFGWRKTLERRRDVRTVMLLDVTIEGTNELVADHVWLTCAKWSARLKPGDAISFEARVQRYEKGYKGFRESESNTPIENDYRLDRPKNVKVKIKKEKLK